MSNYENATIYYLSGTGNTYRVARWAGEAFEQQKIKTQIAPFEKADPKTEIMHGDKTLLGLFLPTHGFTAPWMMIRFALKLPKGRGTHAFVSATRGGTKFGKIHLPGFEGTAAYILALILKIKGYTIRGAIGIDMPLNWTVVIPGYKEKSARDISSPQEPKIKAFVKTILDGDKNFGTWTFVSLFLGILILPFSLGYLLIARFLLAKLFFSTSACNSCGICAANCPANAIQMRGKTKLRPYWTFKCESCMRCMNFCPQNAIEASYLLAVGFIYLASIPVGSLIIKWVSENISIFMGIVHSPIYVLFQYGYMLLTFVLVYFIFHHLTNIRFFNTLFTKGTLSHYYRRYRQPGVKLKDMK
jgi:ferredoxin